MSWQLTALIYGVVSLCLTGLCIGWVATSRRLLRLAMWLLITAGILFVPLTVLFFLAMAVFGQAYDFERRLVIFCVCLAGCVTSFVRAGFLSYRTGKIAK